MSIRKINFLHFDSIFGQYTNPYNCTYKLVPEIRKPIRISLKSIELPITFCNVRYPYNSISYNLTQSGITTTYSFTITEAIYTSISTLLTDINNAFAISMVNTLQAGEIAPVFSINATNKIMMKITLNSTTFVLNNFGIPVFHLGYVYSTDKTTTFKTVVAGSTYSSYLYLYYFSNCLNLNFDNYLNMSLNIPCNTTNQNMIMNHFKIPLNANSNVVYFNSESSSYCQDIIISDPNLIISSLNFLITDRYGNSINGSNYSCTLGIEYK